MVQQNSSPIPSRAETLKVLRAQGATNNPTPPPAPAAAPAAVTAASAPAPTAAAPADAGECLQAGVFDDKQAAALDFWYEMHKGAHESLREF